MKKEICITLFSLLFFSHAIAQNVFSIKGNKTLLNGEEFLAIGLRCSNALLTDETTNNLISHLDEYKSYGLNTISVFLWDRVTAIFTDIT